MKVMIVSTRISKLGSIDALRKEAVSLFDSLRREEPGFQVELVSLEQETDGPVNKIGATVVEFGGLAELIEKTKPDIIHVVEATLGQLFDIIKDARKLNTKIVVTCVDNDPLHDISTEMLDEIVHIADHNECFIFCYSQNALQVLQGAGIRNVACTSPLVDIGLFKPATIDDEPGNTKNRASFTAGFASTPFDHDSFKSRGIDLLQEILALSGNDIALRIPWREPAVAPPPQFLSDIRVHLTWGFVEMADFYRNIDIYVLPFTEYGKNHACPHSFFEAIACGKPVVVTDRAGIAPLVEKYNLGIVSAPEAHDFLAAIHTLQSQFPYYSDRIKTAAGSILSDLLDPDKVIRHYVEKYRSLLVDPSHTLTLWAWRGALGASGKELIKGPVNLKQYYRAETETVTYRTKRFENFPMDIFNQMELQAVRMVLDHYVAEHAEPAELLDIAAGEGRVSEVLYGYGNVTLVENSTNMIKIINDNLKIYHNDTQVTMLKGDFLSLDMSDFVDHFDIVTTFRFIRHFEYRYRCEIYARIRNLLKPSGLLLFDVPNKYTEIVLRDRLGWDKFNIYDVFWTEESIREELQANGLALQNLIQVGQYCFRESLDLDFARPMAWVAVARKLGDQEY